MTNSRAKGYRYEAALRDYLKSREWYVTRHDQRVAGNEYPDLTATHLASELSLKLEAKDRKTMPSKADLGALEQAESSSSPHRAVAVVKVAREKPGKHVAIMRLETLLDIIDWAARKQGEKK